MNYRDLFRGFAGPIAVWIGSVVLLLFAYGMYAYGWSMVHPSSSSMAVFSRHASIVILAFSIGFFFITSVTLLSMLGSRLRSLPAEDGETQ